MKLEVDSKFEEQEAGTTNFTKRRGCHAIGHLHSLENMSHGCRHKFDGRRAPLCSNIRRYFSDPVSRPEMSPLESMKDSEGTNLTEIGVGP